MQALAGEKGAFSKKTLELQLGNCELSKIKAVLGRKQL